MKEDNQPFLLFFLFLEGLMEGGGTFGRFFFNPPLHPGSQVER